MEIAISLDLEAAIFDLRSLNLFNAVGLEVSWSRTPFAWPFELCAIVTDGWEPYC